MAVESAPWMGSGWLLVMFSWLWELVPMFWLMELDLLFAVCGSLCGSSMCLGNPSGPGSVRHLYFHSCSKVALSACLHCRQPLTCPGTHCYASVTLSRPALLAEACWVGVCVDLFLAPRLCPLCRGDFCGLPSAPRSSPRCAAGLLCPCLSFMGPASASRACGRLSGLPGPILCVTGLWALVWDPRAHPLRHRLVCACLGSPGPFTASRACGRLSGLPGPILCIARLVGTCLGSQCPASASWACVRLSGLPGSGLCITGLCVLVWVPCAHPQHRRAGGHLSQLTGPTLYITGFNFYI